MSIHKFAANTGDIDPEVSDAILASFRSDVEQRHSPLSIHAPDSNDVLFARRLAEEMIYVSGAEVKVYLRTDNADFDEVWDEDADPTYWAPVSMKAFFKPEPLQVELGKWGADTENKTEVAFSYYQAAQNFGRDRMLRAGDVLQLPYNSSILKPTNYRVLNATPSGNFRYTWLYITCQVETLTGDITVRVDNDMPVETPERLHHGRESL